MSTQELADLNLVLASYREIVTEEERDGATVYVHNRLTRVENISDVVAFASVYGITVTP